jgi:hypothetical protein
LECGHARCLIFRGDHLVGALVQLIGPHRIRVRRNDVGPQLAPWRNLTEMTHDFGMSRENQRERLGSEVEFHLGRDPMQQLD